MPPPILLGQSDFGRLREDGCLYVDKSAFVREVLAAPAQVMLHPRPRRFGKTLNLSMLRAFFDVGPDRSALFRDLEIWHDSAARVHFQRHPVVALTFKDVKQRSWASARSYAGGGQSASDSPTQRSWRCSPPMAGARNSTTCGVGTTAIGSERRRSTIRGPS